MSGEREPLLGHAGTSSRSRGRRSSEPEIQSMEGPSILRTEMSGGKMKTYVKKCCNVEAAKNKFPIIKWLPKYS